MSLLLVGNLAIRVLLREALNQGSLGTVTFLFTDIESTTRLWEQHPEAMRPCRRRTTRSCARPSSSTAAWYKTTGDGIYAVFDTAAEGAPPSERPCGGSCRSFPSIRRCG